MRLESAHLAVTVDLDQGADLLELIHKPSSIDVLWKAPYPSRKPGIGPPPTGDSMAQWIAYYRGGWQTILPNFGKPVVYRGATLDFHGEAARRPWRLDDATATGVGAMCAVVSTRLLSLPLAVRREIRLDATRPIVHVEETVTNVSSTGCHCMWGHHPVFGVPLVAMGTRIYTGARRVLTDDGFMAPGNDLPLGEGFDWPCATRHGEPVDLSTMPASGSGTSRVLWLQDFAEAWYAIVNPALPLGVGVRWNRDVMPYACFWQEAGGARDFPFFGDAYALAIEPQTSYFGHGLLDAIEKTKTALHLAPGESRTLRLTVTLFADGRAVQGIDADGTVRQGLTGP